MFAEDPILRSCAPTSSSINGKDNEGNAVRDGHSRSSPSYEIVGRARGGGAVGVLRRVWIRDRSSAALLFWSCPAVKPPSSAGMAVTDTDISVAARVLLCNG
ncbi:hypothetical protein PVAR5_6278 [Paecilomyces variotii No. 5]|uniref:Uncharacterized protein n=1 Tax=Byssochlamys spectabilis (strain No. 5 / NBRC 109023) TaxID=1356009 RepID=V5FIJ9_BYSSN|nr:hypothetical protein PVAR5_6278 [Paecilomyces variotii No. 5]